MSVISPSKHCTIAQLEAIQADHYLSQDTKRNYSECEVDEMLWYKRQAKADKALKNDLVDFCAPEFQPRVIVLPPLPVPMPPVFVEPAFNWLEHVLTMPLHEGVYS